MAILNSLENSQETTLDSNFRKVLGYPIDSFNTFEANISPLIFLRLQFPAVLKQKNCY